MDDKIDYAYYILEVLDDQYVCAKIDISGKNINTQYENSNRYADSGHDLMNLRLRGYYTMSQSDASIVFISKNNVSGDIYSKNKNPLKIVKTEYETSLENKNELIKEEIQKQFGMKIIEHDDPNLKYEAMVENNELHINYAKVGSQNKHTYFAMKVLHEMTHIALAYLKLRNPEAYFKLLAYVEEKFKIEFSSFLQDNVGSEFYSGNELIEEFIVKMLEQHYEKNQNVEFMLKSLETQNLAKIIQSAITEQIFQKGGMPITANRTMGDWLQFRKMSFDNFNINELILNSRLDEIYKHIQYKCD